PSVFFVLLFFFFLSACPRDLLSFPTRRSSDLCADQVRQDRARRRQHRRAAGAAASPSARAARRHGVSGSHGGAQSGADHWRTDRSEEHTSELQSRFDLVCRLLLEKKKRSLDNF